MSTNGDVFSNKRGNMKKMKQTKSGKRGYLKVRISINGKAYNRNVHRMVAETFIPNPDNKPEVNHKDGNKKKNRVTNLEWTTRKENANHAYKHGLFGIGETMGSSTITTEQCHEICKLLETGASTFKSISEKVGCSKKIVDDIAHKRSWTYISCDYDFSKIKFASCITELEAKQICIMLDDGAFSSKEIAEIVGCKIHHVKDIKRGKTWRKISSNYSFI